MNTGQSYDRKKACGLNRNYPTRCFKEATGYPVQSYFIFYRMKMSMQQGL
jgi:hypothetical protein